MSFNDFQGALAQIVSSSTNRLNGILGSHTTSNSTERNYRLPIYGSLDFIDNNCEIPRDWDYDTITPKHIMCYNCTDNFSIQSITIKIGGHIVQQISNMNTLHSIIPFIEDITIDGNSCKTYFLDRTKLFFTIDIISLEFSTCNIEITTTGNCERIKLNACHMLLNNNERNQLTENEHNTVIKTFHSGSVRNYNSMESLRIRMTQLVNGFIITNINPEIVDKIRLNLNNHRRLTYDDKYEILLNTRRINDKTIYINLNNCDFIDDIQPTQSYLSTARINDIRLYIGLDEGNENINFDIASYSNNSLVYNTGIGGLRFSEGYDIHINTESPRRPQEPSTYRITEPHPQRPIAWTSEHKPIEGDKNCSVLYIEIEGDYISCSQCHNDFDIQVKESWVNERKDCPMCRTPWTNKIIYKQTVEL